MSLFMVLFLFAPAKSHAGWLSKLCDKLIMNDPYQFEEHGIDYVIRTAEHLTIAKKWRVLNSYEVETLKLLIKELDMRRNYGSDNERNRADEALIRLAR